MNEIRINTYKKYSSSKFVKERQICNKCRYQSRLNDNTKVDFQE